MTKPKKIILISAGGVILIGLIVLAIFKNQDKLISVTMESVEKGKIISLVTATGKVEAKTNVNISSDVMGKIISIPVVDGQVVEKGQLLVEIDKTQSLSDVDQVKAMLASSEADKAQAMINFDRQKQLFERKLISQAEFDLTKNTLDRAVQMVNQNRASLERAMDQLSKCTIRAPIAGTITQLISKVGENVLIGTMNNAGTVIMVISDLSAIVVKADVDETDIAQLALEQPVKISLDAFPDTTFAGKVTEIGNAAKASAYGVQDQVTNFVVTILITDNVTGIKPGMNASVDITTGTRDDVLKIPIQAVVMRSPSDTLKTPKAKTGANVSVVDESAPKNDKIKKNDSGDEVDGVFLVDKGVAKFVAVKTGISDQQYIEIVSGLSDSVKIITGSYKTLRTLRHGDKIKAKERTIQDNKEQPSS